jgi:thiol-disulfide isomerase/thioredoxin
MRIRIILTVLILSGLLAAKPAGDPPPVIQKMTIKDLEGYIANSDHPLIISFWATYCAPCIKEIPYFQSTVARYIDERVELVLVSLDHPGDYPSRISDFAQKKGFTSRIVWLNETDTHYFCPKVDPRWTGGIPSSLFINNQTHYRRFFDRQLTDLQIDPEIKEMMAPGATSH